MDGETGGRVDHHRTIPMSILRLVFLVILSAFVSIALISGSGSIFNLIRVARQYIEYLFLYLLRRCCHILYY